MKELLKLFQRIEYKLRTKFAEREKKMSSQEIKLQLNDDDQSKQLIWNMN